MKKKQCRFAILLNQQETNCERTVLAISVQENRVLPERAFEIQFQNILISNAFGNMMEVPSGPIFSLLKQIPEDVRASDVDIQY